MDFASYLIGDWAKRVLVVAKRRSVLPEYFALTQTSLGESL